MSMPIQLGDIAVCLKSIVWIREKCFSPENNANTRYRELKGEIETFERILRRLQQVLENLPVRRLALNTTTLLPLAEFIESQQIDIGDANSTLEECKRFLTERATYGRRNSIWSSGTWHAGGSESRAKELRDMIQRHCQNATVSLSCVSLELFVQSTQPPADDDITVTIRIPEELDVQFRSKLLRGDILPLDSTAGVPLDQTLESVRTHLVESGFGNEEVVYDREAAIQQKLALLKAYWLLSILKGSEAYRAQTPSSVYRDYATLLEGAIANRQDKFTAHGISTQELLAHFGKQQDIWVIPKQTTQERRNSSFATPLEKKILRVQLEKQPPYVKAELHITRRDQWLNLELARYSPNGSVKELRIPFNASRGDRLIPWYTINPAQGLAICTELRGHGKHTMAGENEIFNLVHQSEKYKLQTAFTGYEVGRAYDNVDITVTSRGSLGVRKQETEKGTVQLWFAASRKAQAKEDTSDTQTSSGGSDQVSHLSEYTANLDPEVSTYYASPDNNGGAVFHSMPPPPLLVFFSKLALPKVDAEDHEYRMWRIDLSLTKITEEPTSKALTVIRRHGNDTIPTRRLSVKQSNLENYDLCAISIPEHPNFNNKDVVKKIDGVYVGFSFRDIETRDKFNKALNMVYKVRKDQEARYRQATAQARSQGRSINIRG